MLAPSCQSTGSFISPLKSKTSKTEKTEMTSCENLVVAKPVEQSSSLRTVIPNLNILQQKQQQNEQQDSATRLQVQQYLQIVSGQHEKKSIQEVEHSYAKPCHVHPDPQIRAQAAKFLFMKHFPYHLTRLANEQNENNEEIDVVTFEENRKIPFLTPKPLSQAIAIEEDIAEIDSTITDSWTCEMNKLWTRATKIVSADRIARLSFEGNANEVLLKRNLQEQTANKFRELFASTFWNKKLVTWLHETLTEHLDPVYQTVYIDSLQILKQKIPSLIDTFYLVKADSKLTKLQSFNDPLFITLSHYKPKKLPRKPIFLLVPSGPNLHNQQQHSPRLKYWCSMFSAMGKLFVINVTSRPNDSVSDFLTDVRCAMNEKIKNCKSVYSYRPIILVGFNAGSVLAAHCALQNSRLICAVICLGFPLKTISGSRGELGDTLLELTCPIQFIVGENSVTTALDDIEDFRERMVKSETNLVVVGGADEKLIVSNTKKRLECLTQSMVDRCITDEIISFLMPILNDWTDETITLTSKQTSKLTDSQGNLISAGLSPTKRKSTSRKRKNTGASSDPNYDPNNPLSISKPPVARKRRTPKLKIENQVINFNVNLTEMANSKTTQLLPFHPILPPNFKIITSTMSTDKATAVTPSTMSKDDTSKKSLANTIQNSLSLKLLPSSGNDDKNASTTLEPSSSIISLQKPIKIELTKEFSKLSQQSSQITILNQSNLENLTLVKQTNQLMKSSPEIISPLSSPQPGIINSSLMTITATQPASSTRIGRQIKPPKSLADF